MSTNEDQPNLFELSGDRTQITYSSTSFTGRPQLSYQDPTHETSFTGDEIDTLRLPIGTLVSVTLDTVPDLHVITFSLLVPLFNLEDQGSSFETQGIETTQPTGLGGPGQVMGALQTYRAMPLQGTARLVDF